MYKVLFVILAVVLILTIFTTAFPEMRARVVLADVSDEGTSVWHVESSPPQFFLRVSYAKYGGEEFYKYYVHRFGNVMYVMVLNLYIHDSYEAGYWYTTVDIPFGSCFTPGLNKVMVNGMEAFVNEYP